MGFPCRRDGFVEEVAGEQWQIEGSCRCIAHSEQCGRNEKGPPGKRAFLSVR